MSDVARIHPHVSLLEMPVQGTLPLADGAQIVWREPRRLLFRRIVRRDGSIVDFRRAQLAESIRSALSEVRDPVANAEELTDRVVIFLANRFEDRLLSTADVALAVEAVLLESGLVGPARAYAAARGEKPPLVDGSDGSRWLWDRVRIVAALCRETGLDLSVAEEIAREVEHTIIHARLDSVTAPLVRELVNARLLERGLEEIRRRHARLGLPVHDILERIAARPPQGDLIHEIGQEVLSQLAMWQMFPSEVSDLYRERLLYVHDPSVLHIPRSRRMHLAELVDESQSPQGAARRILAHRSRVGHHLTVVWDPDSQSRAFDSRWFTDLFRGLSFAPSSVVTEFEVSAKRGNTRAVSAILEAAADVAGECGALASIVQIVLPVSDPRDLPLTALRPCWAEGIACIETRARGGEVRDRGGREIRSKFSLDLARLCSLFEGSVERLIPEMRRILVLIVKSAGIPQRMLGAVRQAHQSFLWPEPVRPVPLQLGLFGVEDAARRLGTAGWSRLAESLAAIDGPALSPGARIHLADSSGCAVRAWFGADQADAVSPLFKTEDVHLFEEACEGDSWRDLGAIPRFRALSEQRLTRSVLADLFRLGPAWRWAAPARPVWCSVCGRPVAADAAGCPSCVDSDVRSAMRKGWFIRPIRQDGKVEGR